ncbi:MAG: hypothetical protein GY805_37080, partial [Chloroflexi bacterium]|nr:hypothetical protein [Chloroflexota bacterium]
MRPSRILWIFLILSGLCSCQRDPHAVESVEIAIQQTPLTVETSTPVPLLSATPSFTSTPTPSSTNTATLAPTLTWTPTSVPTITPSPTAVPTLPAATPAALSTYRLKEWTEQDALSLVNQMRFFVDNFEWNSDLHYFTNKVLFFESHWPLEVAAYEAMLRFPAIEQYKRLVWERLYATSWRGPLKTDPSDQIEVLLENGLNQGIYHPEEWAQRFILYDFAIMPIADVENLFGDGRIIPIYKIETIISQGDDGLYFALNMHQDGVYEIIPLIYYWPASRGYWVGEPVIGDHTGDGLPEFVEMSRWHSGSICYSDL